MGLSFRELTPPGWERRHGNDARHLQNIVRIGVKTRTPGGLSPGAALLPRGRKSLQPIFR